MINIIAIICSAITAAGVLFAMITRPFDKIDREFEEMRREFKELRREVHNGFDGVKEQFKSQGERIAHIEGMLQGPKSFSSDKTGTGSK